MSKLLIESYDALVSKLEDKTAIAETTKLEKREELRSKYESAKIATLKAKRNLEQAIVSPELAIDASALLYKSALSTEEFYSELYENVFGKVEKNTNK